MSMAASIDFTTPQIEAWCRRNGVTHIVEEPASLIQARKVQQDFLEHIKFMEEEKARGIQHTNLSSLKTRKAREYPKQKTLIYPLPD